ncbi:MAG: efflux RND transporter permease subunit [Treponema sp.]|jgi:multidrug efflux pump subunit AcrB|nr:efflux RND transporter permease subunit [Treponema sp.]
MKDILSRPVTALCILLSIAVLSELIIVFSEGNDAGGRLPAYTVLIRHYGVNAREMERTAAIPLEDTLASLAGVKQVLSSSENSSVRVFVRFDGKTKGVYESVRDAAERVYESLPSSAQRPEILTSDDSRIPVWTAAVLSTTGEAGGGTAINRFLEKTLKSTLESIEGVGEVEVSGMGPPEIVISLKPEEAASRFITASGIARLLGMNDVLIPAGSFREADLEIPVMLDNRYPDSASLSEAFVPLDKGTVIKLKDIAVIYERERDADTLSRLDGQKTAAVSILPAAGADLGKLSERINGELQKFSSLPLEFRVLQDRGKEETAAFRSALTAALQGAIAVAVMAVLLGMPGHGNISGAGKKRTGTVVFCILAIPFICLVSTALLTRAGFRIDKLLLAGLSVGVGAAVDAVLLLSERFRKVENFDQGRNALKELHSPLIAGSVTTIAALIPLGLPVFGEEINTLAWAVGTVNLVSLIAVITLLPPLFLWNVDTNRKKPECHVRSNFVNTEIETMKKRFSKIFRYAFRRIARTGSRLTVMLALFTCNRFWAPLILAAVVSVLGIAAILQAGIDTGAQGSEDSVYAQAEFKGGLLLEEVDKLLAAYAAKIKTKGGIKNIQTSARTGSGSVLVSFDPNVTDIETVREILREERIDGGFIYISEAQGEERIWEVVISGDDDEKCRELAEKAAGLCASLPFIRETVLNFKTGSRNISLIPDRERLDESGIYFSTIADELRRGVHGPVVYKRIDENGEIDVRIRSLEIPVREDVLKLLIPSPSGRDDDNSVEQAKPIPLYTLIKTKEGNEPASIRRSDRRRIASFSVRTKVLSPQYVKEQVKFALDKLELYPGYSVEFDREAVERSHALSKSAAYFLLSLLFCYMIIAAVNESFIIPLAVLSVVPPSLAVPALVLALGGNSFNTAAAAAFVAVSGMAVNASVLTAAEFQNGNEKTNKGSLKPVAIYRKLRNCIPPLLATNGTSIAGALPFVFLREGANALIRTLSLVTAFGVGASFLFSIIMIPALFALGSSKKEVKYNES